MKLLLYLVLIYSTFASVLLFNIVRRCNHKINKISISSLDTNLVNIPIISTKPINVKTTILDKNRAIIDTSVPSLNRLIDDANQCRSDLSSMFDMKEPLYRDLLIYDNKLYCKSIDGIKQMLIDSNIAIDMDSISIISTTSQLISLLSSDRLIPLHNDNSKQLLHNTEIYRLFKSMDYCSELININNIEPVVTDSSIRFMSFNDHLIVVTKLSILKHTRRITDVNIEYCGELYITHY